MNQLQKFDYLQDDYDAMFEMFWNAGMRKINKKKAKPMFVKVVKSQPISPWEATNRLIDDIQQRLIDEKQFGFDAMHPTTYLNGERWEDEHVKPKVPTKPQEMTIDHILNDRSWAEG